MHRQRPFVKSCQPRTDRRRFLSQTLASAAAAGVALAAGRVWGAGELQLEIGSAVVDTTPPKGIDLGGFHHGPGAGRLITGIRQPVAARALVLRVGGEQVAIVSLDILGVSTEFSRAVAQRIAAQSSIPAANVRICATHTHSMPAFFYLRQWGDEPKAYEAETADKVVQAVLAASQDLAAAECYLGKSAAAGGNFNRTTSTWKTNPQFDAQSTDAERWLDTDVHVLRFERAGRPDTLWYHFSAHPVCYADGEAGPDWVGLTAELVREKYRAVPAYLQGHCGDVNPGDGNPWRGDAERTGHAVADAVGRAIENGVRQPVTRLTTVAADFAAPLDIARLTAQLENYRQHPDEINGVLVDAAFAKDWFQDMSRWDPKQTVHNTPISGLRLGSIGLVFHPGELYSYYGLAIRRDSPLANTLVVGYTDGLIGYLPDPQAFVNHEYAAATVPGILGLPPFQTNAAARLAQECHTLLDKLANA